MAIWIDHTNKVERVLKQHTNKWAVDDKKKGHRSIHYGLLTATGKTEGMSPGPSLVFVVLVDVVVIFVVVAVVF